MPLLRTAPWIGGAFVASERIAVSVLLELRFVSFALDGFHSVRIVAISKSLGDKRMTPNRDYYLGKTSLQWKRCSAYILMCNGTWSL